MIVLDTNVVSELIRPEPDAIVLAWVDQQPSAELWLSAITAAELRVGAALLPAGRRRTRINTHVEELIAQTFARHVLAFDVGSGAGYAEVIARRRARAPISTHDAQIAAICRQHDAALATRNRRDFDSTGVEAIDPWDGP